MATDTERLDALARVGSGIGLINDDQGEWAVAGNGFQNLRRLPGEPVGDLETLYWISKDRFRRDIRDAIDLWMDEEGS